MPLTAQLNGSIPQQNFEKFRDRVADILRVEMANQYTLNNSYPRITDVWVERFITFDTDTELPAINVCISKIDFANKTQIKREGTCIINIDVYTAAASNDTNGWGDTTAMYQMTKIMGMVGAILSAPVYSTLGFAKGTISHAAVERMFVGEKSSTPDALCSVVGRVQFSITGIETVELQNSVPLQVSDTQIKLDETEKGFRIQTTTV